MQDVQDAVVLHDHVMAVGEGHSWNAVSCQQHRTRESTLGGEPTEKQFGRALDTQASGSRTDTDSLLICSPNQELEGLRDASNRVQGPSFPSTQHISPRSV